MWFVVVSVLPAVVMLSGRHRAKVAALCRRAVCWALRLLRGRACVRSTHAFVFTQCTHGNAQSVLETFDLYADTHPSLSIGPQGGEVLDAAVRRVQPRRVLELGTHCGYSAVRLLRQLPPAGRLVTVETDPLAAELAEELILVAGFKHSQFQVLTCSSAEAIPTLRPLVGPEGLDLVLMDHDPQQYLPDLLALETQGLLRPSGCCVLLVDRSRRAGGLRETLDQIRERRDWFCIQTQSQSVTEILYKQEEHSTETEG